MDEVSSISHVSKVKKSTSLKIGQVEDALSISSDVQKVADWVEMIKAMPDMRDIALSMETPSLDALAQAIAREL